MVSRENFPYHVPSRLRFMASKSLVDAMYNSRNLKIKGLHNGRQEYIIPDPTKVKTINQTGPPVH